METGTTQLRGTSREGHTANRRRGWIGKLRSTTTQRAEGTARLITTIAVIVALIGGAGPAAAQVLVTNLSATECRVVTTLGDFDFVQPFTTGTNASGYQLESISINFLQGGAASTSRCTCTCMGTTEMDAPTTGTRSQRRRLTGPPSKVP